MSCQENSADRDHVSGFSFVGADLRERPWGTSENAKIPTGHPPLDRRYYQFWIVLYATGEPIPVAAAHLRETLREAMATFDPSGSEPALRQMVVVGHSQGGLLTKILAQDSGLAVWDAVVNLPYPASRLGPESRALLDRALIFRPEPYLRRLVFIATPHGGSPMADGPLGRLGLALSRPQGNTARIGDELEAAYGPGNYNRGLRGETFSLRNLSPSSRVILAVRGTPIDPRRAPPLHRAPVAASYDPRAWRRGGPLRELAPSLGLVGGAHSRLPPRGRQAGSHGRTPSNPADPPSGGGGGPAGRETRTNRGLISDVGFGCADPGHGRCRTHITEEADSSGRSVPCIDDHNPLFPGARAVC